MAVANARGEPVRKLPLVGSPSCQVDDTLCQPLDIDHLASHVFSGIAG